MLKSLMSRLFHKSPDNIKRIASVSIIWLIGTALFSNCAFIKMFSFCIHYPTLTSYICNLTYLCIECNYKAHLNGLIQKRYLCCVTIRSKTMQTLSFAFCFIYFYYFIMSYLLLVTFVLMNFLFLIEVITNSVASIDFHRRFWFIRIILFLPCKIM